MELVVAVVVVALAAAMVTAVVTALPGPQDPVDTATRERRAARWVASHPRLDRLLRRDLSPREAGLALLAVAFALATLVSVALGLLLRAADRNGTLARWDRSLSEWGVDHADAWAVDVLKVLTLLGSTVVVVGVAVAVGALEWARTRDRAVAVFLFVVAAGQSVVVHVIKLAVDRPRPDVAQLVPVFGPAFPSGHSAAAAAVWAAVALVLTRRSGRPARVLAAAAAAGVAILVGASRALLGVHWATDVIGGLALGWAWFTLVAFAFGGRRQRLGAPAERLRGAAPADGGVRPPRPRG